jgi:hypothetical protein
MNELNRVLRDIASTPSFGAVDSNDLRFPRCKPGPNNWDNIEGSDFGPEHDFELNDQGTIWLFTPISNAALQWCYKHLPEDAPRWGHCSYVVEHRYIEDIVAGAKRDGLMSEADYEWAMEEANAIQHQGENQ